MMRWNKTISACLACAVIGLTPGRALAATDIPAPDSADAEKWERLQDNVMEYDELADLIKEYNPALSVSEASYNTNLAKKRELIKNLEDYEKELQGQIGDLENADIPGDQMEKVRGAQSEVKNSISGIKKSIKSLESTVQNADLQENRDNLTVTAQGLMISYNQKKLDIQVLEKKLEVARQSTASAQTRLQQGMATETDVLTAQKAEQEAENKITEAKNGLDQLRQSLCLMTGWAYDADPDIRQIPKADMSQIDGINLEEDTNKAIGNNYTLRSYRGKGSSGNKLSTKEIHAREVENTEGRVKIQMERLYNDVLTKRTLHETELTKYQKAETDMQAADTRFQLGLLSKDEYLQQQLGFLEQQVSMEKAGMTLFQALETYRWAVKGMIDLDGQ